MEGKIGQPNTSVRSAAIIEEEAAEQHTGDHLNENTLMASRQYQELNQGLRTVADINQAFRIRRQVNRQAMHLRGDYVVNSRAEKHISPESTPGGKPGEEKLNYPAPENIEDQHLVRPGKK